MLGSGEHSTPWSRKYLDPVSSASIVENEILDKSCNESCTTNTINQTPLAASQQPKTVRGDKCIGNLIN